MARWRTIAGLASIALAGGMLGPVANAQAPETEWKTPRIVDFPTDPQFLVVGSAVGGNFEEVVTVAYVDDTTGGTHVVKVATSIDGGDTFSAPIEFSSPCTTITSLDTAVHKDDTIAAAYTCDDTVVLGIADVRLSTARVDQPMSRALAASNAEVVVGFAGGGSGTAPFSAVVTWVEDGASDDTGYVGVSPIDQLNAWNRDDSPVAIATGSAVVSGAPVKSGEQGAATAIAFNADDSIVVGVVPRNFQPPPNSVESATVATDVSGRPSLASTPDFEYTLVSWTTDDDTVQSILSRSNTSGWFGSSVYDVTSTSGDRGPTTARIGFSGFAEDLKRSVLVYDDTASGTREVVGEVGDDSTTFTATTLSVAGETVVNSPVMSPGNGFTRSFATAYWVSESGGSQRVKAISGFDLTPGLSSSFAWDTATSVSGDVSSIDAVSGSGRALGWIEDNGGTKSVLVSVYSLKPGPNPGPNPPNPNPNPTPATPPSAPGSAELQPGNGEVTVSWEAPASQGSFPVTNYQVQSTPSSAGCLVPATQTQCTVSGLTDGTPYDFEVRALNGGGWGPWLDAGSVTPGPVVEPTIMISGTRGDVRGRPGVIVTGSTTGIDEGSILRPWIRLPGQEGLTEGRARITVDAEGDYTWQRRTGKRIDVQIRTADGEVRSDRITIAP